MVSEVENSGIDHSRRKNMVIMLRNIFVMIP